MYLIRVGSDVAEAQIDDLPDVEVAVLLEIYEVLRLTPDNGRKLSPTGNMYVWDHKRISVTYILLDRSVKWLYCAWIASPSESRITADVRHSPGPAMRHSSLGRGGSDRRRYGALTSTSNKDLAVVPAPARRVDIGG